MPLSMPVPRPSICLGLGWLDSHLHLFKNFSTLSAPVNLILQSGLSNFIGPCIETNLQRALMKQEELTDLITFMYYTNELHNPMFNISKSSPACN